MKKIVIRGGLQEHQKWSEICPCLTEAMGMGGGHIPIIMKPKQIMQIYGTDKEPNPQAGRVYDESGISPCLDSMGGGNRMPKVIRPILTPDRIEKRQNGRRFKEDGEPMFTLTAQDKHGVVIEEPPEVGGVSQSTKRNEKGIPGGLP